MSEIVVSLSSSVLHTSTEWCPKCLLPAAERVVVAILLDGTPSSVVEAVVCECSGDDA